ncbi:hypothetical protein CEE35_06295 [Candidatus Aerophobetes bacterium Ae_b3b]|nr:MAG: hypothetical protein CEE35_06295 [Candidatus Aerophobetes bacterium Ae_b3b]
MIEPSAKPYARKSDLVNKEEIFHRLNEIKQATDYLRKIKLGDLDNREKFLLSRYHLQIILEAMFTIGNQIIANKVFRKPASYKDILTVLYENKILKKELYSRLIPLVDLRNRLVHTYWKIPKEELIEIVRNELIYFEKFVRTILECLDHEA